MSYDIGDGVTLQHTVYDGDGDLIDATVALELTAPDATTSTPDVLHTGTGTYESEQVVVDQVGVWAYTWTASGAVYDSTSGSFAVTGPPADGWATKSDVYTVTRQLVGDDELAQAQAIVELCVKRTPDTLDDPSDADLNALKQMVAWTAVFLAANVDVTTRSAVSSVAQDGVSYSYRSEVDVYLPPLAKLAMRTLSWNGTYRSVELTATGAIYPTRASCTVFEYENADGLPTV